MTYTKLYNHTNIPMYTVHLFYTMLTQTHTDTHTRTHTHYTHTHTFQYILEYIRDGKRFSFLSLAVSTRIRRGPFGHNTATKSIKNQENSLRLLKVIQSKPTDHKQI